MREPNAGLVIVWSYLIIGTLMMLASEKIGSFLKRIGPKAANYLRISTFTFGACVAVLGLFGVSMYAVAVWSARSN